MIDIENEEFYTFQSGQLVARVPKNATFQIDFLAEGKLLTSSMPKAQATIQK